MHGRLQRSRTAPPSLQNQEADDNEQDINAISQDILGDRLTRPNTATAKKAVLWSAPRRRYEYYYSGAAVIKDTNKVWETNYRLAKHYPGTWRIATAGELEAITKRLTKPTISARRRSQEAVFYRRAVEKCAADRRRYEKEIEKRDQSEQRTSSARGQKFPPINRTVYHKNRGE